MNKVYYSQRDSRWSNKLYSSTNNSSQTIKSSGCGPTSCAMVISSLKGIDIYPDYIAEYFIKNGFRTASNGTSWSAFSNSANKYNIPFKQTSNIEDAILCLNSNGLVIASARAGNDALFSVNGHLIVLIDYSNNIFSIYDSDLYYGKYTINGRAGKASVNGNKVLVSKNILNNEILQYFCFYSDNLSKATTKSMYVRVNTSLNIRNGAGTNFKVIGSLTNNTLVTVFEEQNNFGRIGDGKWVSLDYLKSSPSVILSSRVMTVTPNIGLNVREKPSTSSKIVTAYRKGTRVTIYEITNGWAKGIKGWMKASYLS